MRLSWSASVDGKFLQGKGRRGKAQVDCSDQYPPAGRCIGQGSPCGPSVEAAQRSRAVSTRKLAGVKGNGKQFRTAGLGRDLLLSPYSPQATPEHADESWRNSSPSAVYLAKTPRANSDIVGPRRPCAAGRSRTVQGAFRISTSTLPPDTVFLPQGAPPLLPLTPQSNPACQSSLHPPYAQLQTTRTGFNTLSTQTRPEIRTPNLSSNTIQSSADGTRTLRATGTKSSAETLSSCS